MKAPAFDYQKPRSLDAVFELMASHGDEARLLAGGQTLLATLNMRLSEPALLIDITAIEALKGISVQGQVLRIGALATHSEIEASALVAQHAPLLRLAVPHIAHRAIRNLGTWGGSIAYADPAAEWPCCLAALDGAVVVRSARGERRIAAKDFFLDLYTTALAEGELVTACELPLAQAADVFRFDELARRHGDYAIVGLALAARSVPGGLGQLRLAFLGLGTTPIRARRTEALFASTPFTTMQLGALMDSLLDELQPLADLTNSAATKRHLAGVLTRRLLASALAA
ncbi:MAG: xanthine dehydrogenase family protein subunit M [Burkholderiaceae bacterium]|nr:xanthine dehydrogenase family protein subunit M [Burkholderiaceae bacterium]